MNLLRRHPGKVIAAGSFLIYLIPYLATTNVRPQGTGGLTGPLKARVFKSENHLLAFYPLYLIERWGRNLSLTDASYRFNADFEDGQYKRMWLYGDGKYNRICYEVL